MGKMICLSLSNQKLLLLEAVDDQHINVQSIQMYNYMLFSYVKNSKTKQKNNYSQMGSLIVS